VTSARDTLDAALDLAETCGLTLVKSDILLVIRARLVADVDPEAAIAFATTVRDLGSAKGYRWNANAAAELLQRLSGGGTQQPVDL
jgi:hypothetical protein